MVNLKAFVKDLIKRLLGKHRIYAPPAAGASHKVPLPDGAEDFLNTRNPELQALEKRYADCGLPMSAHSWWSSDRTSKDLEIAWFRGDNAYVWQTRHMGQDPTARYFLYAQDVLSRDKHGWLTKLQEDGGFGCWVFGYDSLPPLSRDLLDSVNELSFLDEHLNLHKGAVRSILDIGAGYGRLAHRSLCALPEIKHYYCMDGVATSTFLCEYYLDHRELKHRASVIPLDQVNEFHASDIDLLINVHSFSEMSLTAIKGWFNLVKQWDIPYLFIIPNDPTSFLSIEKDHKRENYLPVILEAGYEQIATRPVIENPDIRRFVGVNDHFFLFRKKS